MGQGNWLIQFVSKSNEITLLNIYVDYFCSVFSDVWIGVSVLVFVSNAHNHRLKSPASRLFAQPIVQAQIKENIIAPRHWPFEGDPPMTGGGFPPLRVTRKMFPLDDVILSAHGFVAVILIVIRDQYGYGSANERCRYIVTSSLLVEIPILIPGYRWIRMIYLPIFVWVASLTYA